ncbi:MAG: ribonuclease D [Holosporales bacterium]|jgi:ribonuclease D
MASSARPLVHLYENDLPAGLAWGAAVAVDSETMGLNLHRDRLCLVQLSNGDGTAHLVRFSKGNFEAPNLRALLVNPEVTKIFHYARFDMAAFLQYLGVITTPVFCTKIASRLIRTFSDRHGLKELVKEICGIDLSKQQQSSDWGAPSLNNEQLQYAASDVLHLHVLRDELFKRLKREGRLEMAQECFAFLPTRVRLDLLGWGESIESDIFSH